MFDDLHVFTACLSWSKIMQRVHEERSTQGVHEKKSQCSECMKKSQCSEYMKKGQLHRVHEEKVNALSA
jgi:hypothetical protein